MAEIKFPKGCAEWLMFQDYWKICQKYWIVDKSQVYWDSIVKEMVSFSDKYKGIPLAKHLMTAFFEAQEEKYKAI